MENLSQDELFERCLNYPDSDARRRYSALVGIDSQKDDLVKSLGVFVSRSRVTEWWKKHYGNPGALLDLVINRPPLIILAGDVGTGKTALAESVSDAVARKHNIDITLFPVSLSTRGAGRVGEMTMLISSAFDFALNDAEKKAASKDKSIAGVILLIDEADALAQSRELAQMHHEDRAGVNAFIRGIDRIMKSQAPMAVIMCTNRLSSIDPAVQRRATLTLEFMRPNKQQRRAALHPLTEAGFKEQEIDKIAEATGENKCKCGFTYSDIVQRLMPAIVLESYPESRVCFERALKLAQEMKPTPPFQENISA